MHMSHLAVSSGWQFHLLTAHNLKLMSGINTIPLTGVDCMHHDFIAFTFRLLRHSRGNITRGASVQCAINSNVLY